MIAAIVGIAASIFVESVFGVIGFALFGVMILLKQYENTTRISELETQIKNTLDTEENKLSVTTTQMQVQVHQVEVDRDQFKQTVQQLELDNQKLQGIEQRLTAEEARLRQDNTALEQQKNAFQQNLDAAKENARQIRVELQSITAENLRFGTATGLFEHDIQALNGTKQQLEQQLAAFNQAFDGDLGNLVHQIQVAKDASKALIDSSAQLNEELHRELEELQADVDQRHQLEQQLKANIQQLDQERQQIELRTHELGQKENELGQLERDIEERREAFNADVLKNQDALLREREEITQEEKQMQVTLQKLNETVRLKGVLIQGLDQKILEKEAQLKKLKAEIKTIPAAT